MCKIWILVWESIKEIRENWLTGIHGEFCQAGFHRNRRIIEKCSYTTIRRMIFNQSSVFQAEFNCWITWHSRIIDRYTIAWIEIDTRANNWVRLSVVKYFPLTERIWAGAPNHPKCCRRYLSAKAAQLSLEWSNSIQRVNVSTIARISS